MIQDWQKRMYRWQGVCMCVCSEDSLEFLEQLRISHVSAGAGRWFDARCRRQGRGGVRQHVRHDVIVSVEVQMSELLRGTGLKIYFEFPNKL